jgi:alginate O-acetyltransferase complex protein AlgI
MLFTEPVFIFLFLPAVLGIYFLLPKSARNAWLIFASLVFYFYGEGFHTLILLFSVVLNYVGGISLTRTNKQAFRRLLLAACVGCNVLLLVIFKYANFVGENVQRLFGFDVLGRLHVPHLRLPIGISFFTFMGISYLVDVYRRQIKAQKNPINPGLYITLFPHLIAGPIVRYSDIAQEIVSRTVSLPEFSEGIKRFTIGFGKKMLIANVLALPADQIFRLNGDQLSAPVVWLGIVCYTLQIYYDFSGYTDMAIGLARMFGFHFPENFNYPYISTSITEFWRRWHISLSTWFRDYVFFPLGIRRPAWRVSLNLLIVFFLCGLWHGASWHFVFWGLYHGAFLVLERTGFTKTLNKLAKPLRHGYALLVIMIGWVLFRAESLAGAGAYFKAMSGVTIPQAQFLKFSYFLTPELVIVLLVAMVGATPAVPFLRRHIEAVVKRIEGPLRVPADFAMGMLRAVIIMALFISSSALSAAGTYNPFIYFRF